MKILVVFTGGTIGSVYDGEYISADTDRPYKLLEMYNSSYPNDITWESLSPYRILSENLDGKIMSELAKCVGNALKGDYDGIIVTHGSDTLQYSAAFLSYVLGMDTIPVVLVAANYVLEDRRSNGLRNFAGAVEFIESKAGRGVFVSYTNTGEESLIHRGTRLMPHVPYSDYLYSLEGKYYVKSGSECINPDYSEDFSGFHYEIPDNPRTSSGILWLKVHPGICLPKQDDNIKSILISAYHSGTVCTGSDMFREWVRKASGRGTDVYLVGQTEGPDYETCSLYRELGINVLPRISPIAAYVRLWLENAGRCHFDMNRSVSGDICRNAD